MTSKVRIGVDVGSVRVGVAICDPAGVLATPLITLEREGAPAAISALAREHAAVEIVIGLPLRLSGAEGPAAAAARSFGQSLGELSDVPIRWMDERLTTVQATAALRESGRRGRSTRAVIDQAAAVAILQAALDADRARETRGGTVHVG